MVNLQTSYKQNVETLYEQGIISLCHLKAAQKLRHLHSLFLRSMGAPSPITSHFRKIWTGKLVGSRKTPDFSYQINLWKNIYSNLESCFQKPLLQKTIDFILDEDGFLPSHNQNMIDYIKRVLEETRQSMKRYRKMA